MNNKAHLIKLLHIAKTQLSMDDTCYRANLAAVSDGKQSSKELTIAQLEAALSRFQTLGFTMKTAPKMRLSPSSKAQPDERSVIRAIWFTMAEQGFIHDRSETAINSYIQRQTSQKNGGVGISECTWLDSENAAFVIKSLKLWHKREMVKALNQREPRPWLNALSYQDVCAFYGRTAGHDAPCQGVVHGH